MSFEQSRDLPLENQSSLLMGYVIGTFDQKEKIYASHILSRYLCENNQSYLTSLLLDNGYAEDAQINVIDGILQPYLCIDIYYLIEKLILTFDNKDIKYIYFIAETKGSMQSAQLKGAEQGKIACACK